MKKTGFTILMVALLAFGLTGCGNSEEVEEEPVEEGVAVEVQTVGRQDISTENNISGTVVAEKTESVYVSVSARCTSVPVEQGDIVRAGDVICVLDLSTYRDNYELASMSYNSAQQSYNDQSGVLAQQVEMAEKNYHDTVALFEIGAASQLEVDNAKLTWDNAVVGRNSALSQLEVSMKNSQTSMNQITDTLNNVGLNGVVKAPISGVITTLSVAKESYASAGMPLVTISSTTDMKVSISVSETLVAKLEVGAPAHVTVNALGLEFDTQIRDVASAADQMTKLYPVGIVIPAEVSGLFNGMFAEVQLYTDSKMDTVVIPTESILIGDAGEYVVILDGQNRAKHVPVQTGLVGDGVTEILSGLSGGETLVAVGQSYLEDGDLARVVSAEG